MAELLLVIFLVGAIASVRGRHDPHRHHGDAPSVFVQKWTIVVLAVLGALLILTLTLK
ncbi:MAG: hypothetical protein ACJ8AO_01830 [Gemmatimonadaceae bacterium]